jgi:hypothetical protein
MSGTIRCCIGTILESTWLAYNEPKMLIDAFDVMLYLAIEQRKVENELLKKAKQEAKQNKSKN